MNETSDAPAPGNRDDRVRTYERPAPPFHQQHPVFVIALASLSLIVTLFVVFFVI